MANAIASRAGGIDQVPQFVLTIDRIGPFFPLRVKSFVQKGGSPIESEPSGEIIVIVDWTALDGG